MSTPANILAEVAEMIDAFSRDADGIVNAFAQTLEDKPPPEIIYHYTNDIGMRGILETGKIWLTDVFSLNDPSELRHGCDLAVEALTDRFDKKRSEIEQFCHDLAEMLRFGMEEVAHFFTCSFSETGDDLGQWRAYADDGHGFALGFDAATLEKAFVGSISGPNFMTFPISYREVLLREIYGKVVSSILPLVSLPRERAFDSDTLHDYMGELLVSLSVPIFRASLFFKHEAYQNEREYRFIQLFSADNAVPDFKFRHQPYRLVRYREFDLAHCCSKFAQENYHWPSRRAG